MADEPLDVKARMDVLLVGVEFFSTLPPVDDLLANIEAAHTLGPLVDPTAYRNGMENLRWQTDVLRAVQTFQRAIAPIGEMIERARVDRLAWEGERAHG